ncbi:DUF3016 domain-containing protein [Hansschlegelia plantiphila]|uniref:DUF3016 domain-containing protein n=1 Tax=Hansschlegelia plantiphila TaxID=374655 RepID=A0A9W6J1B0_9HYPH|nr:DUF3016 domain-containing protein [Hansschlegelia plantiphila]GLK68897.1 hypothetical protein GCM10008179_25350 [Hansschlegelia plantiphila]
MRVRVLLFAAALAGAPSLASAEVAVRAEPGPYVSSWSFRSAAERDSIFRELARYLERTGARMLPKGRSASIELVEIDPAGRFEPWRPGFDDVRVLRDVTPPRVKLRYAVTERGRTLARGEETVTDIDYLSNISARSSGDRLVKLKPERR